MSFLSFDDYFRLRYTKNAKLVGRYSFAQLPPVYYSLPKSMKCLSETRLSRLGDDCGVHCFVKDRDFERIWTNCDLYVEKFRKLPLVVGPDFSLYRDNEKWRRIYNCGRNYAIVHYLLKHGVNALPVASWAFLADLEWSLDGFQEGCTLVISSNGCLRDASSRKVFVAGIDIIQRRLKPRAIYVCGNYLPELAKYNNIQYFPNFSESRFGGKK